MKTTQVSYDSVSTYMPSPEDSLSFERSFPITDGLRGSGDLSGSIETNSNPSPSTVSSEAPKVPPSVSVSPAANSSPLFTASLSINSSRYSTSPALDLTSLPTAAPVTSELKPAATSTIAPHAPNQLIVKFKQGIATAQAAQFHSLFGAVKTQKIKLTGAEIWKLSGSLSVDTILAQYGSNPIFEYIEPDYIVTKGTISAQATFPNDPGFNQLWGLHNTGQSGGTADADIDAPEAWDIQTGDPNLVIGVVDTGVDYNHPDLAGNIWTNPGEIANDGIDNDGNGYIDDIRGWDFAYNDNDPSDVDGHGTHVSGTIAGKGNNGVGVTGVAWNAKIMPLKFLDDTGSGSTSNAILAINYATAKGVKLTNNSWGGGGYSQALYNAINAAGQAGALFIAAAGNSAQNTDTSPSYPASYNLANIISVASTTRTDSLSSFSNYGLTSVDLGAPGSAIYSTTPNNTYATYSGTSMASPHVAGAAALLWSQNPTWTAQQVKDALMNTGDPIAALAGKTVSGKRLNVFNALAAANLPSVTVSVSPTSVQEDGTTNLVYSFTRTNLNLSSPLTVNFGASGIANAAPVGSDPADYNVLTGSGVTFDPTTKLGTVTFAPGATTATVEVDPIADTVQENSESVILTVNSGTGYIGGSPNTATGTIISEEGFTTYFWDDFANNSKGWTLGTEWQIGAATTSTGQNYGNPDPGTDNTPTADNGVAGVVIGGNASTALHDFYYLTSPIINTSTANQLFFEYARWLNSDYTPYMQNTVEIFNGSSWVNLWSSGDSPGVQDNAWTPQQFDISAHKSASTQIRFGFNVGSTDVWTVSSWNLDDVKIYGDGSGATISIAKTTDGNEAGSASNVFTLTRTGDLSSALTVNYTLAGTATLGSDYNDPSLGQATFAAFSPTATITLPTIDDLLSDPGETIITTITAPAGYTISGPDTATATILDNDGDAANNNLVGTSFADALAGVGGNDTLDGGDGNDTLDGGVGVDSMDGGDGNDTYFVDNSDDIVKEVFDDELGGTADTVFASVTYSLAPGTPDNQGYGIENLTLTGSADINATGNDKNNVLTGNSGNNVLDGGVGVDLMDGGDGNDTLFGGLGNDILDGGADNDTYLFDTDLVLGSDRLIDASGIDTLNFAATTTKTINLNLGSTAAQTVTAGNLTLTLASATAFENVIGGSLNDTIVGNSLANSLTGEAGNDSLTGGLGNDTLDGGLGNDTLNGGADNDTYLFDTDLVLGSDRLIDASGIDTLNFAATTTKTINLNLGSTAAQTVTAGNLTLTLASATAFENVIGGSLNDTIVGNSLANSLTGEAGNDSLTGGLGKDILTGGDGLDTLNYNSLGESLLSGFDVIQGYNGTGASLDSINAPGSIAPITLTASKGTATSLTAAAIQLVLTNAAFAANTAAAFKVTGQNGTFIALNNGVAGFQAASDAIIQLSDYDIAVATPVVVI